jgi:integration host factor subunit beta
MNVTKQDLCTRVAKKFEKEEISSLTSISDLRLIFDTFIDEIMASVAEGSRIEIRGFGCFKPVMKKKRIGRNPRTGEVVAIPPYLAPYFKFSKDAQKNFEAKKTKNTPLVKS